VRPESVTQKRKLVSESDTKQNHTHGIISSGKRKITALQTNTK